MEHRISAGAFVEADGRFLLVHHKKSGHYDFWVAPGGGVQGTESLAAAAEREVTEETGLIVAAERLVYIEEFYSPALRCCKFWFLASLRGGSLSVEAPEAAEEHIVEAAWHTRESMAALRLFPEPLRERFWRDRSNGFAAPAHIPLKAMEIW